MKKIFTVLTLAILYTFLCEQVAMAAVYDCEVKQALKWDNGKIVDDATGKHVVFNFNDETGALWMANNAFSPFSPLQLTVVERMSSGYDLTAKAEQTDRGHVLGETVLFIRSWGQKDHELVFLFEELSLGDIFSGTCKMRSIK